MATTVKTMARMPRGQRRARSSQDCLAISCPLQNSPRSLPASNPQLADPAPAAIDQVDHAPGKQYGGEHGSQNAQREGDGKAANGPRARRKQDRRHPPGGDVGTPDGREGAVE